eukprot:10636830-Alexandrium_andersonii.AAC.1
MCIRDSVPKEAGDVGFLDRASLDPHTLPPSSLRARVARSPDEAGGSELPLPLPRLLALHLRPDPVERYHHPDGAVALRGLGDERSQDGPELPRPLTEALHHHQEEGHCHPAFPREHGVV